MEFDVVFFHNIDNAKVDDDLIKRYIYVGVSRAAFFLGITLNADKKDITKYFKEGLSWGKSAVIGVLNESESKRNVFALNTK